MKGIQFQPDMVSAIHHGVKTETRRVMIPQPDMKSARYVDGRYEFPLGGQCGHDTPKCPYGYVGDRLYVKENVWQKDDIVVFPNGFEMDVVKGTGKLRGMDVDKLKKEGFKFVNAKFMPSGYARMTIKISGICCQKIQDITLEEVANEGTDYAVGSLDKMGNMEDFKNLWNSINAKRGYSWESNPVVWKIKFGDVITVFDT